MAYSFKLTVRDVLQRPHFKSATLISGQKGVYRVVNWVHIVEVKEIRHLLNGNELISPLGSGGEKRKRAAFLFSSSSSSGIVPVCVSNSDSFSKIFQTICASWQTNTTSPSSYSRTRSALSTSHRSHTSYMRRSNKPQEERCDPRLARGKAEKKMYAAIFSHIMHQKRRMASSRVSWRSVMNLCAIRLLRG